MFRCKGTKGFSLIELVITIAVLMVIMAAVSALMHQMSTASANQRRRQAQHGAEEQARTALLNIVRDVRASNSANAPGLPLQLNARTRAGNDIIITYNLAAIGAGDVDVYDASEFVITRLVEFVSGGNVPIGDGDNEWPNPFSSVSVRNFTVNAYTSALVPLGLDTRLDLGIELWIPIMPGEIIPTGDTIHTLTIGAMEMTFREWEVNSSVSLQRVP